MERNEKAANENFSWWVQVHSETHLDDWLKDYFSGLEIKRKKSGITLITGKMQDLPEVYGLILKLRDSGVVLLSLHVERVQNEKCPGSCQDKAKPEKRSKNGNI